MKEKKPQKEKWVIGCVVIIVGFVVIQLILLFNYFPA